MTIIRLLLEFHVKLYISKSLNNQPALVLRAQSINVRSRTSTYSKFYNANVVFISSFPYDTLLSVCLILGVQGDIVGIPKGSC